MKEAIFLISCTILALVPLLFVVNKVYQDGVLGRMALLAISFSSWTYLIEKALGVEYNVLPQTAFFFGSTAVFLCWHLWRFHRRVLGLKKYRKIVANDIQQTVQFPTFASVCPDRGSEEITVRLCRNPKHEAANTGIAVCEEQVCPRIEEALKK